MNTANIDDKNPTPDLAEDNAFFPSPYSLSQYTALKPITMVRLIQRRIQAIKGLNDCN